MKSTLAALTMAALIVLTGCNTGTPGGPGAEKDKQKGTTNTIKQGEDSFSLSVPMTSTHIKQGESKVVTVGIKRGKNFDQNVSLKFDDVPKGVTLDPAS